MDFRILGPLLVQVDGEHVQLGPKLRAVLTVLLLRANHTVPATELQAILRSTGRSPTRATVRSHIHHLRRVLEPTRPGTAAPAMLVTSETGYLLRVQPEQLDTVRFQRLVQNGRRALDADDPVAAAEQLHTALELWRGPIPDDVADSPFVQDEIARLEGLRLTAREARIQADLQLGRHAELLPELELLAAQQPDHEGLRRLLALALYRSHRVDEAAETCRRGITRLLARGHHAPDLQQLQTAILRRAPELDWKPPKPARRPPRPYLLPPDVASFTDRRAELATLHASLRSTRGDTPPPAAVLAIDGNPGIGKSALAIHAAHQLASQFTDGVLYANLRAEAEQPVTPAAVLDYFLRALGVPDQDVPADLHVAAARYRSELAGKHVLVVLDNAANETQARALLPGTPGSAAILTSRARLALSEAVPLTLDLLDEDDAVHLLARLDHQGRVSAEPAAGRRVAHACGRLPLALQIAGARLGNRRTWTVAHLAARLADERRRLGELRVGDLDVRASFALSYQDLPAPEARTFRLLGLLETPDTTPGPVAALTDTTIPHAEATLERLLDSRLLEQTHPGRYRLHDLLRLFAREQAEAQESTRQRHAALARALHWYLATADHADRLLTPTSQRPHTQPPTTPFADRTAALTWLDDERANLVAATRQAATHRDPAVAAIAWRLSDTLFRYFDLRKHWSAWQAVCEPAVHAARRAGNPVDHARALNRLGIVYREQRRLPDAMAQQQQALAISREAGDLDVEGSILNNLGNTYQDQRDFPAAIACHQQRLAIAQRLGDRYSQGATLNNLGDVYRDQGRYPEATTCLQHSLEIFRDLDERRALAMVLNNLGEVAYAQGRFQEAITHHQQGSAISHEVGDRYSEAINLLGLGHAAAGAHGRPASLQHWRNALAILASLQAPEADEVRALLDAATAAG
ncbi:MAG TPA: tetratricopeptide repeat protein [Actinomycetota bacterium]|nr:tetratricopeptide repeat protein [Actinomycetota bacterium]